VGVDGVGEENQAPAPPLQVGHQVEQVLERAAQPVELVNVDRIARAQLQEQLIEFDPGGQGAGGFLLVNQLAPGLGQGVELKFKVLVPGRDAGVANLHENGVCETRPKTGFRKLQNRKTAPLPPHVGAQ
jgi:hypothetical protein